MAFSQAQPQQAQYQNNGMVNGRQAQSQSVTPSSFHSMTVTPTNFSISQRSVPNLPQLLQQKQQQQQQQQQQRAFQPLLLGSPGGGSSSNLSNRSPNQQQQQVPYYADLLPTTPTKPRVHGEWKSVDNLPQSLTPRTGNIDFGESPRHPNPAKNLNLTFDLINSTSGNSYGNTNLSKNFPEYAKIMTSDNEPLSSPEYDHIRPISDQQQQQQMNGNGNLGKGRPGPVVGSGSGGLNLVSVTTTEQGHNKVNVNLHSHHGPVLSPSSTTTAFSPSSVSSKLRTPSALFSQQQSGGVLGGSGSNNSKNGAESTDCSSLGRSSTSDGDFGTLGDSAVGQYIANAGKCKSYIQRRILNFAKNVRV
jgi:hypothetical protein